MQIHDILWFGVLFGMTAAYLMALSGARAAKNHDLPHHSRKMIIASTLVGIWLVAYVTKQVLLGRDEFGGTSAQYWQWYVPLLIVHTGLAVITIILGVANLYSGLTRLRMGTGVGAMVSGVSRHRFLGRILIWTFSGTLFTAYLVYLMLFHWFG